MFFCISLFCRCVPNEHYHFPPVLVTFEVNCCGLLFSPVNNCLLVNRSLRFLFVIISQKILEISILILFKGFEHKSLGWKVFIRDYWFPKELVVHPIFYISVGLEILCWNVKMTTVCWQDSCFICIYSSREGLKMLVGWFGFFEGLCFPEYPVIENEKILAW